ncbi:MAG: hypothetical protein FVQ82_05420 [Planctomycetes bacterium]|nr:hypothetical protein [Planctomycetota bacterium]
MKVRVFVIACLLLFSVSAIADEVVVSNPKALFSAERIKSRKIAHPLLAARLSPSGTHLIYPRMVPATPPDYETTFKMIAYEIATGKEKNIEVSLPRGYESVYTRFNFFNPAGDKLVMAKFLKQGSGRQTEIVYYDFKKNKVVSVGIKGQSDIAMFDNTNENILVNKSRSGTVIKADLSGVQSKVIQMGGWVHTPSMFSPYAAVFVTKRTPERKAGLQMWNMKTAKKVADVPVNEKNDALDDVQGHWTADGRYFFYLDLFKKIGEDGLSPVSWVWDVEKNEHAAELFDAMAVGYGPTKTTMVMAAGVNGEGGQEGFYMYDVKTGKYMDIGPKGAKVIHACGNKVLYMLKENGKNIVYVADLSIVKSKE